MTHLRFQKIKRVRPIIATVGKAVVTALAQIVTVYGGKAKVAVIHGVSSRNNDCDCSLHLSKKNISYSTGKYNRIAFDLFTFFFFFFYIAKKFRYIEIEFINHSFFDCHLLYKFDSFTVYMRWNVVY